MEKVEAVYKKNPLVEQIWVYGNSFESALVGVVVPNEAVLMAWAAENNVPGDFAAVVKDPETKTYVWGELNKTAKEGKLKVHSALLSKSFKRIRSRAQVVKKEMFNCEGFKHWT